MIKEQTYEVLFYKTPQEFVVGLDTPSDPNERTNIEKKVDLGNYFESCKPKEYIILLMTDVTQSHLGHSYILFCF